MNFLDNLSSMISTKIHCTLDSFQVFLLKKGDIIAIVRQARPQLTAFLITIDYEHTPMPILGKWTSVNVADKQLHLLSNRFKVVGDCPFGVDSRHSSTSQESPTR